MCGIPSRTAIAGEEALADVPLVHRVPCGRLCLLHGRLFGRGRERILGAVRRCARRQVRFAPQRYRFGAAVENILAGNPASSPVGTGWADVQTLNGAAAPGVPAGVWDWLQGNFVPALFAYGPGLVGPQDVLLGPARVAQVPAERRILCSGARAADRSRAQVRVAAVPCKYAGFAAGAVAGTCVTYPQFDSGTEDKSHLTFGPPPATRVPYARVANEVEDFTNLGIRYPPPGLWIALDPHRLSPAQMVALLTRMGNTTDGFVTVCARAARG